MIEDLYLASCCIALFSSGLIFKRNRSTQNNQRFLHSGFFALLLIPLTGYLGMRYGTLPDFVVKLSQCVILLFCALTFLYYQGKKTSPLQIALHMLPFTLFYFIQLSDVATTSLGLIIIYFVIIFSYLAISVFAFCSATRRQSKREVANIATIVVIVCLAGIVTFGYLNSAAWLISLWHTLNLLICCYITISAFRAVYGDSRSENVERNNIPKAPKELLLDKETANDLSQQLLLLFTANKVYLDNSLCLKKLSLLLNLTTHQTSELLNVHMKTSFYRLLNRYRVLHACELLKSPSNTHTITEIMYNSGFNNKNTFYKEFKQQTGASPSMWIKHHTSAPKAFRRQYS
ncbi:helix-turn-helix domain-containing protein [Pseudoalteromonas sp. T1lg23B]|uniref:helix-turn-helix domain-containing protein n=1 Tax=Pseudoalteromonas sp. T1lg23B TaxID=2077097 RepID=UPI000CF6141D|nr:helix-turn-helix domain-containing protein [Pseudoalteromonas sp. T1lg23B]